MLRLLFIALLASICIIHIQAEDSLQDLLDDELSKLKTTKSDKLQDRLSVLKNSNNALTLWNVYKGYYKKTYKTPEEHKQRMEYYIENLKKVIIANYNYEKGLTSYKFELNTFGDMDEKEFLAKYTGLKVDKSQIHTDEKEFLGKYTGWKVDKSQIHTEEIEIPDVNTNDDKKEEVDGKKEESGRIEPDYRRKKRSLTFPDSLDYRPRMNPAENQGACGSCYAFATAATVEGAYAVKKNYKMKLSKQSIVDCVLNYGCNGGWMAETLDYIKQHDGLQLESSYPYHAARGTCSAKQSRFGPIRGYGRVTSNDEEDMKIHLNLYGPLVIGMDAKHLQFLGSGPSNILDTLACTKTLNHAVVIVGYGTHNGQDYWLIRNSWGTDWADHGHFKIARNKGMCGVNAYVHYVLL